jgi:hypothetical protein
MMARSFLAIFIFTTTVLAGSARADTSDDYLKGFISALMKYELHRQNVRVSVLNGDVTLHGIDDAYGQSRTRLKLQGLEGVRGISFGDNAKNSVASAKKMLPPKITTRPEMSSEDQWTKRLLFSPAIADPRSPRFSASWHSYLGNSRLSNVGSVSFGETLTLADMLRKGPRKSRYIRNSKFDLNFQGTVFSIFDLDGQSKDLVNSDFWAAMALSWRKRTDVGDFSAMSRIYHQSSHLGDEFILFNKITEGDRVNLSYEGIDLTAAWEPRLGYGLRFYGGGGFLMRREPSSLDPWSAKTGMELEWPKELWGIYPVAAVHIQTFEDTGFEPDLSIVGGLQFNDPASEDRQVRLLLSYFNGYSPNGQFYDEQLEYVGFGFQYQF